MQVQGGHASIQQKRIFLEQSTVYDGFLWVKKEHGDPHLSPSANSSEGKRIVRHQARNDSNADVHFLVASSPTTRGDRIDIE